MTEAEAHPRLHVLLSTPRLHVLLQNNALLLMCETKEVVLYAKLDCIRVGYELSWSPRVWCQKHHHLSF